MSVKKFAEWDAEDQEEFRIAIALLDCANGRDRSTLSSDVLEVLGDSIKTVRRLCEKAGLVMCVSRDCVQLATTRAFWPGTHKGQEYPLYCDACCKGMSVVADAMGARMPTEPLPPQVPPEPDRHIDLSE